MRLFIDIDGTIAMSQQPDIPYFATLAKHLGISSGSFSTLDEVLSHPVAIAEKERRGPEQFQRLLDWLSFHPSYMSSFVPIPGSVQALQSLSKKCKIEYWTCRYFRRGSSDRHLSTINRLNEKMQRYTHDWLRTHNFPSADRVVFCETVPDKLRRLAVLSLGCDDHFILIDNAYDGLVSSTLTAEEYSLLRNRLVLVGFGCPVVTQDWFTSLSLLSWSDVSVLEGVIV